MIQPNAGMLHYATIKPNAEILYIEEYVCKNPRFWECELSLGSKIPQTKESLRANYKMSLFYY
jgi:hypothetical protein